MTLPSPESSAPALSSDQPSISRPPLCGWQLHAIRAAWWVAVASGLMLFLLALPYHIIYISSRLPMETSIALMQLDMSPDLYVAYLLLHDLIVVAFYILTGLAIFRTRSNEWMALFVSLALITFGVTVPSIESVASPLNSLSMYMPVTALPVAILQSVGLGLFLLIFYLFPDGVFMPRWTRPLAVIWVVWLGAWAVFSSHGVEAVGMSPVVKFVLRMVVPNMDNLTALTSNLQWLALVFVVVVWFGSGVAAQILRYTHFSTVAQRRQTKWVVLGMTTSAVLYFLVRVLPPFLFPVLLQPGSLGLRYELISLPLATLALIITPVAFNVSLFRYRLWDVDYLINRTMVYTGLSAIIVLVYVVNVFVVQRLFSSIFGTQSTLFVILTTLALGALFAPLRQGLQRFIDRRFFREKVNFRQAFTSFSREVRTIIDLPILLRTLVYRTTDMLYINYGGVYLLDEQDTLILKEARLLPEGAPQEWKPTPEILKRLRNGQVISQPEDSQFPMLAPLSAPQPASASDAPPGQRSFRAAPAASTRLLGVLALGPMRSGLHYNREDTALLLSLADQAGTAIYVAGLIQESQAEAERRMEAEQRLEAYRASPVGRAEALSQHLTNQPEAALVEIHALASNAGKDPDCAGLAASLPQALEDRNAGMLGSLAEGFNYLYQSQFTPALAPIGLGNLVIALEAMLRALQFSPEAEQEYRQGLKVYRACLRAFEASSVAQIMDYEGVGYDEDGPQSLVTEADSAFPDYLAPLAAALKALHPVAEALHAGERVDTAADKLAYLASAVNNLRHVNHLAGELGSADQPLIEQIAGSWLAIITSAMTELQTGARLACRLLTRNTWQGDVVSLALSVQNQGRGAALQLKISLAPAPDYTLIDETAFIERLAPGEEAQVSLRVRPHLSDTHDHFRARFVILYTDPRGPDQVENFADVVHLLATGGEFQFIPNPYVVGTPLKTGSPLFFGREDVVRFIQSNLSAGHRNNLVLIGQRRTGKTSLLKQLPDRLEDDTLPVYVDGQTLGLDPGMSSFFLNLATEIAFALEDHGFELQPPEMEDFASTPAAAFERVFLPQVRQAIGQRHLLIMFDEFEELETAVRRGDLEPSIFGFLRHLIQHEPDLSVIFCGTHRLEQLASDYWNILFNISLYQHIAYLGREEAMRLVQQPVASFNMQYDDLALDKMWRVTAGHPYFLQLLCHSLVNQHNKTGRSYVTIADVNAALDEILASGEAHFVYLWAESSPEERLVLTALSRLIPLTGQAGPVQIVDFFQERGVTLERSAVNAALHTLTLREILQSNFQAEAAAGVEPGAGEVYRWKLGLLGLWVEKYQSLSRVINEAA